MTNRLTNAGKSCLLRSAAVAALLAAHAPAFAQTAGGTVSPSEIVRPVQSEAADPTASDIVVTGSRLAVEGFSAPTPVAVVSGEDLKLSGTVNVERLLSQSPQFVGSTTGGAQISAQGAGTADLNLRGFGATRNLVLVNGRRFAIAGPDLTTDLNTIPSALVKRVEVVTGGSSAVYGSDAITGVTNFILRDDFEGVEARAQMNAVSPTRAHTKDFTLTFGGNFAEGRGNTVVSANYLSRDGILRGERGGFTSVQLTDGCVVPGSEDPNHFNGKPFIVPSGQTCRSAGGQPGFILGGSGDIPNGRISGIPTYAAASPQLRAAYDAAGLTNMGAFGFTFNQPGTAARPAIDPDDRYNLAPDNLLIIPQKRYMINSISHYDITPGITAYMELHYSRNEVQAQLAPTNVGVSTLLNVNNPYLTPALQNVLRQLDSAETGTITVPSGATSRTTVANDGLAVVTLGRRYIEVGPRQAFQRRDVYRGAFGVRGQLGDVIPGVLRDLSYDAYYTYARSEFTEQLANTLSRSGLQAAQLSNGTAAPLCNVFGQNISPACAAAISTSATSTTSATQQVAVGTVTGKLFALPAGDIAFNLGLEWRKSEARFSPDKSLSTGDVLGFGSGPAIGGSITAKEVFGELRVPILADQPFFKSLSLNGAFRYSHYDLKGVGGVFTFLGGGQWQPSSDISFRGQFQRAIRAPNINELYSGLTGVAPNATDPCSSRQPTAQQTATVRALCVATGVPADLVFTPGIQPNAFFGAQQGGNPDVDAERSNTVTFGTVLTPSFLPRLRFSVDYFKITLDGAIAPLGGGLNNTLNLCYNVIQDLSSPYCRAVGRDPNGSIGDQNPTRILFSNTGQLETSGIDFVLRYRQPLNFGLFGANESSITLGADWTYLRNYTVTPVADLPNITNECVGAAGQTCSEPLPRWRGVTRVTWDVGPASFSLRHRYIGGVTDDRYLIPLRRGSTTTPNLADLAHPVISAKNYIDLSFTADVLKGLQIYGGINNVFNTQPPVVGTSQQRDNSYPGTYDIIGTEFFFGATVKF